MNGVSVSQRGGKNASTAQVEKSAGMENRVRQSILSPRKYLNSFHARKTHSDYAKAVEYYDQAAAQGHEQAAINAAGFREKLNG